MLLKFTVQNYRSIDAPVTLDMTAVKAYRELPQQLIPVEAPGMGHEKGLPVAALYGANGTGKTSVLRAFGRLIDLATRSDAAPGRPLPYEPFAARREEEGSRTRLEVEFVIRATGFMKEKGLVDPGTRGIRVFYALEYDRSAVLWEELAAYPKGRKQLWFERMTKAPHGRGRKASGADEGRGGLQASVQIKETPRARFGEGLRGLIAANRTALAVILNNPNNAGTRIAYEAAAWFAGADVLLTGNRPASANRELTTTILDGDGGDDRMRQDIKGLLRAADLGIEDVYIKHQPVDAATYSELRSHIPPTEDVPSYVVKARVRHIVGSGEQEFGLDDESDGTDKLYSLSGWVVSALRRGGVLMVDELDASLHPALINAVIGLFADPETNPNRAQLVFSAQSPLVLADDPQTREPVLRRDQVWFTQKGQGGATGLTPLSDYAPRQGEPVAARYLSGRYVDPPRLDIQRAVLGATR